MDVRLPSGVLLKGIPEGTSKDEIKAKAIKAGLATEADFAAPTQQEPMPAPAAQEVQPPAPQPAPPAARPITQNIGTPGALAAQSITQAVEQSNIKSEQQWAELEKTNPYLAAQIRAMGPGERALVGMGMGLNDLARGTGLADTRAGQYMGFIPGSTQDTDRPLTDISGAATAGQIVGQAAPFMVPGAAISNVASIPGRIALGGALGATEGAVIQRGTEQSGQEQVKGALVGAGIGIAAEAVPIVGPALAAAVSRRIGRPVAPQQLVRETGELTPEFRQYLDSEGITPEQAIREAQSETGTATAFAEAAPTTAAGLENLQRIDIPAALAAVNPRLVKNYVDAGINIEDIPLAAVSRNNQVADMSAQLAAIPGSLAKDQALKLADAVRNTARQTIEEAGGSMQTGQFSEKTLNSMRSARETIYQAENDAYTRLGQQIDARLASMPPLSVRAPGLKSELIEKAKKLRETGLSAVEAATLKVLSGKPSYYDIDNLRRDIGGSIGAMPRGLYATQDQATLKRLYGQLQDAQNNFARGLVGSDELRIAQDISKQRHALQDQIEFFGQNDGLGSMVAKLGQVATGARNVDYAQFDRVMSNIPEQYQKGALATVMNQALKISPDTSAEAMRSGAFAGMWSNIRGDAALNSRVKKILGDDSYEAFDKLADMAKGVSRALGGKPTGVAAVALREFDKPNGIASKLSRAMRLSSTATGVPGGSQAAAAVDGVAAIAQAGDNSAINNVTRLISSPTFMKAAVEAARNPAAADAKALSAQLMKTKAANDFMSAASADARKQIIAAGGIPLWLMTKDDSEEQQ